MKTSPLYACKALSAVRVYYTRHLSYATRSQPRSPLTPYKKIILGESTLPNLESKLRQG